VAALGRGILSTPSWRRGENQPNRLPVCRTCNSAVCFGAGRRRRKRRQRAWRRLLGGCGGNRWRTRILPGALHRAARIHRRGRHRTLLASYWRGWRRCGTFAARTRNGVAGLATLKTADISWRFARVWRRHRISAHQAGVARAQQQRCVGMLVCATS